MITLQRPTNRSVRESPVGTPFDSSGATADTFGASEAQALETNGRFVDYITSAVDKRIEEFDTTRLLSTLSDFELMATEQVQQMARDVPATENFTRMALDQYKATSQEFIDAQPEYLKKMATEKVLGIGRNVAATALRLQTTAIDGQAEIDAANFSNNVANKVRYGNITPEDAFAEAGSFTGALPAYMRDKIREGFKSDIRQATLTREVDINPTGAIAAIEAGQFNDIDPRVVENMYGAAQRQILQQRTAATAESVKAESKKFTDPVSAAEHYARSQGVDRISLTDNLRIQRDVFGLSNRAVSSLSKDKAAAISSQLRNADNAEDFYSRTRGLMLEMEKEGITPDIALRDLRRFGDMPAALDLMLDIEEGDPRQAATANWLFTVAQDDKAFNSAIARLPVAEQEEYRKEILATTEEIIGTRASLLTLAGADPQAKNRLVESIRALTAVGAENTRENTKGDVDSVMESVRQNIENIFPDVERRTGRDHYLVPKKYDGTITQNAMNRIRERLLDAEDIVVIPQVRTVNGELQVSDAIRSDKAKASEQNRLKVQAGWVADLDNGIRLVQTGTTLNQPIMRRVNNQLEPIAFTFEQLVQEILDNPELSKPKTYEHFR